MPFTHRNHTLVPKSFLPIMAAGGDLLSRYTKECVARRSGGAPALSMKVNEAGTEATLCVYDVIGKSYFGGIDENDVVAFLDENPGLTNINLRINSPGGSIFAGQAMFHRLAASSAKITTYVDGLAASMASYLMLVGDEIHMADGALVMIHNPLACTCGEASDLRKTADLLDTLRASLVSVYEKRTGKSADDLHAMMDAETWMNAQEAVENGFADTVDELPIQAAAFAAGPMMAALMDGASEEAQALLAKMTPSAEGDDPPAPEGDDPPAPEGDDPPAPEGDDPPAPEGDDPPAPEGDDPPAPEGKTLADFMASFGDAQGARLFRDGKGFDASMAVAYAAEKETNKTLRAKIDSVKGADDDAVPADHQPEDDNDDGKAKFDAAVAAKAKEFEDSGESKDIAYAAAVSFVKRETKVAKQ